jgi:ribonuclease Z
MTAFTDRFARRLTRRELLRGSGIALGGLAVGGGLLKAGPAEAALLPLQCEGACYPPSLLDLAEAARQQYSYLGTLDPLYYYDEPYPSTFPGFLAARYPELGEEEMRVTFLGSAIPPVRQAAAMMSVFVEVGWDASNHRARDSFVFDCGSGVAAHYGAMEVGFARMDKIFLTHLHGDHMGDLAHIYCFGPSGDRVTPQYVFGPGPSGVKSPRPPRRLYDDGTRAFCRNFREAMRWHTESFSFQNTSYRDYWSPEEIYRRWGLPHKPVQVSDDAWGDGFSLVPIELEWTKVGGVAYENQDTGVRVTHFPVIHNRKGSIGYKLEWRGVSMIFTGDTKPEWNSVRQASNGGAGIDVFVHEMVVPPEIWAMQNMHLPVPGFGDQWDRAVDRLAGVQDSSHTPQGAFGYLLSQISPLPGLTVATHFPAADDTVACAWRSVQSQCDRNGVDIGSYGQRFVVSGDRMVISVDCNSHAISQRRGEALDFGFSPVVRVDSSRFNPPKYATPYDQIDRDEEIQAGEATYCDSGY